ncbi:MAG: hypothetical protein KDK34_07045, partial [Leptospiraceae bacterium]|nr:hypothetical protein [Leptospiraceae bacterium]
MEVWGGVRQPHIIVLILQKWRRQIAAEKIKNEIFSPHKSTYTNHAHSLRDRLRGYCSFSRCEK